MDPESVYKMLEAKKARALELLAPLGFKDNEDGEAPGSIFHPGIGETFDISAMEADQIIAAVFARGLEQGVRNAQALMRKAVGL